MSDGQIPNFDYERDHELKPKERVLVIDPNGYDLWEGVVMSNDNGKVEIHYPEYPDEDEIIDGIDNQKRILVRNRTNTRIFRQQEMAREQNAQSDDEEEEENDESSGSDESNEPEYKPQNVPAHVDKDKKKGKRGKKAKKNKKGKKDVIRPRPEGARSNPRRGTTAAPRDRE